MVKTLISDESQSHFQKKRNIEKTQRNFPRGKISLERQFSRGNFFRDSQKMYKISQNLICLRPFVDLTIKERNTGPTFIPTQTIKPTISMSDN